EGVNPRDGGPLGEILGDVAERATDLEHGEAGEGLRVEIAEQRAEKMRAALLLEGEVECCAPRALARDEHSNHALAVMGTERAPVDRKHARVPDVDESVRRLAHRAQYINRPRAPRPRSPLARDREQHVAEQP